jgi:hypothetical protein
MITLRATRKLLPSAFATGQRSPSISALKRLVRQSIKRSVEQGVCQGQSHPDADRALTPSSLTQ